jgi:adenylate cyclase
MGVGIDTGEAVVGNFGSPQRFSYTAMGDHVNIASRLEALNKLYGTEILVSDATRAAAGSGFRFREVDRVRVVGRREALVVHELLGGADGDALERLERRATALAPVLAAYRAARFDDAVAACEAALAADPDDALVAAYLARCRRLSGAPPGPGWDGVWDPGVK